MFRPSRELKKIGHRLLQLCSKNPMDGATADAAIAIIREHQFHPEVINARSFGKSPILLAYANANANNLNYCIVHELLKTNCVDVTPLFPEKRTLLHIAAWRGHDTFAEILLAKNAIDINARDKYGCTALMYAALNGKNKQIAAYLKAPDLLVNAQSNEGCTALINALNASSESAELLLQDPRIEVSGAYKHGAILTSALCEAILSKILQGADYYGNYDQRNRNEIIRHIVKKPGADINFRYYGEGTVSNGGTNGLGMTKKLYSPNAYNGCTPLMLAAKYNNQGAVRILLDAGADCSLHNDGGITAEQCAPTEEVRALIRNEIARRAVCWPRRKDTLFARTFTAIACQQRGVPKEVAAMITKDLYVDSHADNRLNDADKILFDKNNWGIVERAYVRGRKFSR